MFSISIYLENVESRYLSNYSHFVREVKSKLECVEIWDHDYDSCKTYFIFVRVWSGDNIDIIE